MNVHRDGNWLHIECDENITLQEFCERAYLPVRKVNQMIQLKKCLIDQKHCMMSDTLQHKTLSLCLFEEEEIELEEPIERYEDAPKSLIEKIKSTSFIKKAAKAMAGIVAGVLIIAGVSGLSQKDKNNMNVITEETEEKDEEQEIEEETVVKEETAEETKDTKSMIEQMQEDALQDIIDKGTEANVHQDVFTAASNENEKKVGNNTLSWENATPGGIYAVKDNEKVKINLQDAEKYINEGYDIVSAYINEGEIIGFDKLELTQGLGSTEKTR